jgi:hypothetical protein
MGSVVEDLDGDGHSIGLSRRSPEVRTTSACLRELALVGCSGNRLFRGSSGFGFVDATDDWGVRESGWGWGALAEDLNNDGHRELLTVEGQDFGGPEGADPTASRGSDPLSQALEYFASGSVRLWRGGPTQPLDEVAKSAGFTTNGLLKAVVAFDHDDDGDLDLVVTDTGRHRGSTATRRPSRGTGCS